MSSSPSWQLKPDVNPPSSAKKKIIHISTDPRSNQGYQLFREDPCWMGIEYHRLTLQRQGCHPWTKKLSRPQIARPGREGSRECGWELPTTTSAHLWHAVTRKVPCCQQDTVHGLFQSGKGIRLYTQMSHLVYSSQFGIEEWLVWLIQSMYENARSKSLCWLQPEWRAQCESGYSPRLLPETHYCSSWFWKPSLKSLILDNGYGWMDVPGKTCIQMTWITGGTAREADPLEDLHGSKWTLGQHWQN